MSLSASKRIRLNRTLPSKEKNVERRRSSFRINAESVVNNPDRASSDSQCASRRNAHHEGLSSPEVKVSNKPNGRIVAWNKNEKHACPTCVVQLKPVESKHPNGRPPEPTKITLLKGSEDQATNRVTADTKGKLVLHQSCTQCLRSRSEKKQETRLITSACGLKSCESDTISEYDHLAKGCVLKLCDSEAKETFKRQAKRKPENVIEMHPVVQLCDIANICEFPADFLHARCILPDELKTKSIICFKTGCHDKIFLKFYLGPYVNSRVQQPQQLLRTKVHSSPLANQRPKGVPDVKNCPLRVANSVRTHDKHVRYCNGINGCENQSMRRQVVSNGNSPLASHITKVLKKCDSAVLVVQSTTVSSSCELGTLSESCPPACADMMKVSSSAMLLTSGHCDHKDGVEDNGFSAANTVALNDTDKGKYSVQCYGDASSGREREVDEGNAEFFSCQRTTPYQACPSCARTYLPWPFQKLRLVDKNTHSSVSMSSLQKECDKDLAVDTPAKLSDVFFGKMAHSIPAEGPAGNIKMGNENQICTKMKTGVLRERAESLTSIKKSANLVSCSKPESLVGYRGCSHQPNALDAVNHDQEVSGRNEDISMHFWKMSRMQKERFQQFKVPLKKCNKSANFEKNQLRPSEVANSITEPCGSHTVDMKASFLPCASVPERSGVNIKERSQPAAASQLSRDQSEDGSDDGNTSPDEDLVEYGQPTNSQIMCEIKDACPSSYQGTSFLWINSGVDGASGDVMDLVKAYEQDAIVLDVIPDDPDLFCKVSEEKMKSVGKNTGNSLKTKKYELNFPPLRTNHSTVDWDSKTRFTERPCLGLPDQECEDQAGISPDLKEKFESETSVSDDWHSLSTADDIYMDCDQNTVKETVKAEDSDSGHNEYFWKDLISGFSSFSENQSEMSWDVESQQDGRHAEQGANVLGFKQTTPECNELGNSKILKAPGLFSSPVDRELYCKFYFSSKHVCFRKICWFLHEPQDGDEKFCMEIVCRFSRDETQSVLQRAAAVFISYYQKCLPGIHFDMQGLMFLLSALFKRGIIKDMLAVMRVAIPHKILPPSNLILAVFEYVRQYGLSIAVADLLAVMSMCVDAGMVFTTDHFKDMQRCLEVMNTPVQQMDAFLKIKCRGLGTDVWDMKVDIPLMVKEVKRCRKQEDWVRLGCMFHTACVHQGSLPKLHHLSRCVILALLKETTAATLPVFEFIQAACQRRPMNGLLKNLLGRIGVSLLFRYCGSKQWGKARQLLDVLNEQNLSYVGLKSLFESSVSQYQMVNMAAEVFLNTGNPEGAFSILNDNEWTAGSSFWACDEEDMRLRQAVLCRLAESYTQRNMHRVTLDILTHLPGLERSTDADAAPKYSEIFNVHLNSCLEKQNLSVASDIVDYMVAKNIPVDFGLLRGLIHKLGKQNIWLKAQSLYKHAMSMGCYPQALVNQYCRLLPIPHSLSEVEMAIALEVFIASSANEIEGPSPIPLQVVLKRKGGSETVTERDYSAAGNRLLSAAQMVKPRLVVKYATVNLSQEQVFTLEPLSACKWLMQNM